MNTFTIDGISTHVEITGTLRGDRPIVMLSHSLALNSAMWRPQMASLSEQFDVIRYDSRGHGKTAASAKDFSVADLAQDVVSLLDVLNIDRVHFVGLSMGGMIGQQLAISHPQRVRSLVLCNTLSAYGPEAAPMWQERIDTVDGPQGMAAIVEATVNRWFTAAFRERNESTMAWVREQIASTTVQGFQGCCRALMQLDLTHLLHHIQQPTLVIAGEHDPTTTVAHAQVIANAINGAALSIVDAAHISNVEQPQRFEYELMTFLQAQER